MHDLQYFLVKWEAIILPPYRTTSFQSVGASISHLTLHLAFRLFDLVTSPAVNYNIYLLFFPGDSSSLWSILILVFCLFWPGLSSAERHLEVTAMADYVPFLGLEDLREILTAVLHKKAKTVQECRPLKVTNYLQVRMLQIETKHRVVVSFVQIQRPVNNCLFVCLSLWGCFHQFHLGHLNKSNIQQTQGCCETLKLHRQRN